MNPLHDQIKKKSKHEKSQKPSKMRMLVEDIKKKRFKNIENQLRLANLHEDKLVQIISDLKYKNKDLSKQIKNMKDKHV